MKNKLFPILLNQYFIAFIISLVIIYFLPDYFTEYKLELKEQTYIGKYYAVNFIDLDNDNLSEKIIGRLKDMALFIIYDDNNNVIDQWTFLSNLNSSKNPYWFYDTDNNGFKEIYFTSQIRDSVFLNIIEPISVNEINSFKKEIFVDTIHEFNKKFTTGSYGAKFSKYKVDGVHEVFFTLGTGFAGYPRNAYKYNLKKNEIEKSVHLTNVSMISGFEDIDDDGFEDIMFKSFSHGNKLDSTYTLRSDNSLWLNVLDYNLNFLFNPIEIKVSNSDCKAISFCNGGEYNIIVNMNSRHKDISPSKLLLFSNKGELIKEKIVPKGEHQLFLSSNKKGFILFNKNNGNLDNLNFKFKKLSTKQLESNSELFKIDLNEDGLNEWLNVADNRSRFTIYDSKFKEGHTFNFPSFELYPFLYGVKQTKKGNQLYIQNGDYFYIFDYLKNPYFYFKYLFYLGIYLSVLGLVLLIIKGQKIRTEKQIAIEKQIAELQIKTIKNQVDPHFVFNAINTISEMMLTDNKIEADDFICKFSNLMRSTLQKSDKIKCTLKEEIDYVENYIQLQQIRFNNSFKYQLSVAKNVNVQIKVPKHVLYSYVENAIKHGLASHKNGLLKIEIAIKNNLFVLAVEDNGGGLGSSPTTKGNSTGNGLSIMEHIYELYTKLYKKKITHQIIELKNDKNVNTGLRVEVSITL